jgi:hypothetical protein
LYSGWEECRGEKLGNEERKRGEVVADDFVIPIHIKELQSIFNLAICHTTVCLALQDPALSVCVCACVRAYVRVCVCMYVCVCVIYPWVSSRCMVCEQWDRFKTKTGANRVRVKTNKASQDWNWERAEGSETKSRPEKGGSNSRLWL